MAVTKISLLKGTLDLFECVQSGVYFILKHTKFALLVYLQSMCSKMENIQCEKPSKATKLTPEYGLK